MDVVRLLAVSGLRRRWGSWLLVVLIVAATGGGTLGCLAAARRTASAHERYLRATNTPDLDLASDPHCGGRPCTARDFRSIDGVDGVGGGIRLLTLLAADDGSLVPGGDGPAPGFALQPGTAWDIGRPLVREGRLPRLDADDEVLVTPSFARAHQLALGDRFTVRTFTIEQVDALMQEAQGGPKVGRSVRLRVVGVGRWGAGLDDGEAYVGSPAVGARLERIGQTFGLTTRPGAQQEVIRGLRRMHIRPDGTRADDHANAQRSIRPYVTGLTAYAVLLAVAGVAIVGQALRREVRADARDEVVLASMGISRRQRRAAVVLRAGIVILAGTALAIVVSIASSRWTPIGPVRHIEPDQGIAIDVTVALAGALAWVLVLLVVTALTSAPPRLRRASVVERKRSAAWTLPLVPTMAARGLRSASTTGSSGAARAAMVGVATVAFLAAGAVTFDSGLQHLLHTPRLYGAAHDVSIFLGYNADDETKAKAADSIARELPRHRAVRSFAVMSGTDGTIAGTQLTVSAAKDGDLDATLVHGRRPIRDDEVMLGLGTARRIGAHLGGSVRIDAERPRRFTVVGTGVFDGSLDEAAGLTTAGLRRIVPHAAPSAVAIDLRAGTSAEAADELARGAEGLAHQVGIPDPTTERPEPPSEALRLRSIHDLPAALTVALALTGLATLAHALLLFFRSKRHEHAVIRVLGFDRRQTRAIMTAQAALLTFAGLVAGIPLGVALGRWLWTGWASDVGVVPDASTPLRAVLVAGPVALLFGLLAVARPIWRHTRTPVAAELRRE